MTPNVRRWATMPEDSHLASPAARQQAVAMERHGYVQHDLDELTDGQRMLILDGCAGGVAPAIYHRYGIPHDEHGVRDDHVFETYPESPFAERMSAQGVMETPEKGAPFPRIAFFLGDLPDHREHFSQFYNERDRMHRAEAQE